LLVLGALALLLTVSEGGAVESWIDIAFERL
jgi:hypothetical protein